MKFKELREKYKSKYPAALVAAAVKIAIDMGGAMTPAVKKIEAMKRGLSNDPIVKDALRMANESVKEDLSEVGSSFNQDLTLATKNMARLSKKESGQDKKDYQAVSRALAQGNLGAVKKAIKAIKSVEIQGDILNILVGYNDLIAKMYPKAVDGNGNLKSGMSVDKMIGESVVQERMSLDKLKKKFKRDIDNYNKRNKDLPQDVEKALQMFAIKNGEINSDDPDEFEDWLIQNIEEAKAPKAKSLSIYGSEISGLKNKKGRPHTVKPLVDRGKLAFRVTDEFGSFKTVDLKTFAKEFG